MPTSGSTTAFTTLVAAQSRLKGIGKIRDEARAQVDTGEAARRRYFQLQKDWKGVYRAVRAAAREFSVTLRKVSSPAEFPQQ